MEFILYIFYGLVGIVFIFYILQLFITNAIDRSKEINNLRTELVEIKKQLKNLNNS
ncbi:hypothetical protein [Neobacillus notoginsengisoli]|uniref:hypothetical protein n=1 Tax=Neobacillus notoginsengisoli TaxID=1578198 RepID=UPI0013145FC4|nr:hypothetical protein [Neobacillus notoginsengisoli]